eukprot:SAG11_NODE_1044_length_6049_cov_4.050084_3_plen_71_part_00
MSRRCTETVYSIDMVHRHLRKECLVAKIEQRPHLGQAHRILRLIARWSTEEMFQGGIAATRAHMLSAALA